MDILTLKTSKADAGAVLTLKHPATEEPLAMTITLLGTDSAKSRAIQRRKQQATIDRMAKGRNAQKLDAGKLTEETVEDLIELTTGWTGFEEGGVALECSAENKRRIYSDPGLAWVKEQAADFIGDRANFFASPSTH